MVKNGDDSIIRATAQIRGNIATIINFDEWFNNEVLDDSEYEFIILAGFGGYNLGIMIKSVEYIVTIDSKDMQDNSMNNSKTNFIANIKINGEERLCTIFDCDKLLLDTFDDIDKGNQVEKIEVKPHESSEKAIFFADDSSFIRKMVQSLFEKLSYKYKLFENGQDLLDSLKETDPSQIGLIITDLEMPIMDGNHLIREIKQLLPYKDINIIVHTNMSNFIIENSLVELGANEVIGKINMSELSNGIEKYFEI
jgi:two-component system chemotaxis response regulator CheV